MPDIELDISKEFINELIAATKQVMIYYKLGDSALIDSIEWQYKENFFVLIANDYFIWVERGRRPMARKVPVEAIIKWMKSKNLRPRYGQTINSLAFAIQNAIYKSGIKAKQMLDPIINVSLDLISEYIAEDLSVSIADAIAEEMTFTLGD